MSDDPNATPAAPRVCAVSGEETSGKQYILRTTDGPEELVNEETLFPTIETANPWPTLEKLLRRVQFLEEQLLGQAEVEPDPGAEAAPADRVQEAAQEAAAPVKKAPKPRKAVD